MAQENANDEDIWMPNIVDKYVNRPDKKLFDGMCLAQFASEYRMLSSAIGKDCIKLKSCMGYIKKKQKDRFAVIRYLKPRLTETEKYFAVMLRLYLPFRFEVHLKPEQYTTLSHFSKMAL